jgi:hypothetical protein
LFRYTLIQSFSLIVLSSGGWVRKNTVEPSHTEDLFSEKP